MDSRVVVLVVVLVFLLVVVTSGRWSRRGRDSTAGHYDPKAVGQYRMDPATQSYRLELPTLPRAGAPPAPGSGPPHRRRRRHRRPDAEGG